MLISFSAKRCAYCPRPSFSSQSDDLLHRGSAPDYRASPARIGEFIPNGCSVGGRILRLGLTQQPLQLGDVDGEHRASSRVRSGPPRRAA